jgi:hypothetical protein
LNETHVYAQVEQLTEDCPIEKVASTPINFVYYHAGGPAGPKQVNHFVEQGPTAVCSALCFDKPLRNG